ncbi:hypothetical protein MMPV_005897 [Pyropia vietnamensis]
MPAPARSPDEGKAPLARHEPGADLAAEVSEAAARTRYAATRLAQTLAQQSLLPTRRSSPPPQHVKESAQEGEAVTITVAAVMDEAACLLRTPAGDSGSSSEDPSSGLSTASSQVPLGAPPGGQAPMVGCEDPAAPPPRNGFETLLCILLTLLRRTRGAVEELAAAHSGWVVTSLQLRPALDRLRTHHGQLRALFSIIHLAAKLSRSPSIRFSLYVDVRDHPELGAPDKWRSAVRMDDFFGRYFGFHYLPDMRNVLQVVKIARGSVGAAVASSGSGGAPSLVQSAHILGWGWLYSNMTALQALGVPVHGAAAIGAEPAASSWRSQRSSRATVEEVRSFFNLTEDPFVSGVSGLVAADVAVDKAFLLPPVPDWLRHSIVASAPAHLSEDRQALAASEAFGEGDGEQLDDGGGRTAVASKSTTVAARGNEGDAGVATAAMKGVDGMFHAFTGLLSLVKLSSTGEAPPASSPGGPALDAAAEPGSGSAPAAAQTAAATDTPAAASTDRSPSATVDAAGTAVTPIPTTPLAEGRGVTADGAVPAPTAAVPVAPVAGSDAPPRPPSPPKARKRARGKPRVAGVRARLLSHAPRAVGHLSRHAVPRTVSTSASSPPGVVAATAASAAPTAGAPVSAATGASVAPAGAVVDAPPGGSGEPMPPTVSFEVLQAELAATESDDGDGRDSSRETSTERLRLARDESGASSAPTSRFHSLGPTAAKADMGRGNRPSSARSGDAGGGGTGSHGAPPSKASTLADSNGGLGAYAPHSLLGMHLKGEFARLSSSLESMLGRGQSPPATGLILHIHGGGFISQSSLSHSVYLREWAAMLPDAVILSVDYSLAPEAQFPVALNEAVHAYQWALANGPTIGTTAASVVVAGDSAGGNLAVALCLRALELGIRRPDGLCLAYPALNLTNAWSPSRLLSFFDVLLPLSVLELCIQSYIPSEADPRNPLVSPLLMSDEQLAALPPLTCVVGSIDPLLDDAVTLATRLRRIGRAADVNLRIYESMPHGFLHMNHVIPEARHGMRVLARAMATYLQIPFMPDASGKRRRDAGDARTPSSTIVFDA